jgi:small conductance mechanosensitive channel
MAHPLTALLVAQAGDEPALPLDEGLSPAVETLRALYDAIVGRLPLLGISLVVLLIGLLLVRVAGGVAHRAMARRRADRVAVGLVTQLVKVLAVVGVALLALTIAGVPVGPALAGLGLAGLALAFALQSILENFVAGLILLMRKPFRVGEAIRTVDFEGTVQDLDLRVTKLLTYDGELVLIPNVDVYSHPLTNLTRLGKRRTRVTVGIDYRDDHDAAREVIREAVASAEGVLADPAVQVFLTELGDSSVDFEVRYWTLPDILSVRSTQDRVLSAAKRAIEEAGMTIPWPIRTLVVDGPVPVERQEPGSSAAK